MRGFLYLDDGELDRALAEGNEGYRVAGEKSDYILMARARILQCIIESSYFEEQIDNSVDPGVHAQRACDYAREALECARHTENRRLLARAYVWQGLVFMNDFFNNPEAARQCCDEAALLLRPEGQDYIWDDLQQLKAQILRKARVDTALREWSQGLVGEKTFQQITEEFASIVIPRVGSAKRAKYRGSRRGFRYHPRRCAGSFTPRDSSTRAAKLRPNRDRWRSPMAHSPRDPDRAGSGCRR